jgi:hypothetical protein
MAKAFSAAKSISGIRLDRANVGFIDNRPSRERI